MCPLIFGGLYGSTVMVFALLADLPRVSVTLTCTGTSPDAVIMFDVMEVPV